VERETILCGRSRRPRRTASGRSFRKACRSRFASHLPHFQGLLRNPRTCFEGPFGEVIRATGPMAKADPFRFSTKYQDDETDLLYYGYRYYNASIGRWLSRDPLDEEGGDNLYAFVDGDALNSSDALGQSIFKKKQKPPMETVTVLTARWTFDIVQTKAPPKKENRYDGGTDFVGFPGPGLTIKDCECGGAAKSCGCGGVHLVSVDTDYKLGYWYRNKKGNRWETNVNVPIVKKWWEQYASDINSLGGCVSHKCADCRKALAPYLGLLDGAEAKLELLDAEVNRALHTWRAPELNDWRVKRNTLKALVEFTRSQCDAICNEEW